MIADKRIVAIDFFCGCGGLSRGLLNAGIQVLAGVDIDKRLQKTYEHNNKPSRFLARDIRHIDIQELRDELGITGNDIVLYAACTPCQPFSTLNQMKGKDDRKDLLIAFAELVQAAPPDFILVENVPGLKNAYGREIYALFREMIESAGFHSQFADLLDAKDYGVPQVRKRFIMLASRTGDIQPPKHAASIVTVREAISKYPIISDGEAAPEFLNHEARRLQPHHRTIVQAVPEDGGSRQDVKDTSILLKCHQKRPNVHKDVFGRMAWDKPAPTLTRRCTDVYCGRFTHPEQNRGISLREAAAIQTFADDYEFFGTFFHIAGQIGNAVPVKLAEALGEAVISSIPKRGK